jgi:Glyoxalase/Bleomycin resistance protein/Dioxygenase superfamily
MVPKAGYFTPLLHVMDVRRSIRFYELLGFELIDLEGDPRCPGWARMHCEGGAVMFLLAEEPFDPTKHAVLTAMYTPDLPALREHLLANGIAAPTITYPGYMPSGSLSLRDPDGLAEGHQGKETVRSAPVQLAASFLSSNFHFRFSGSCQRLRHCSENLVNDNWDPSPRFFVSVASKRFSFSRKSFRCNTCGWSCKCCI